MAPLFKHDVFICYCSKNRLVVRKLVARLERDGVDVWFDKQNLEPGDFKLPAIIEAIHSSRYVVVCSSKQATASDWVLFESAQLVWQDVANRQKRVLPLRLNAHEPLRHLGVFEPVDWFGPQREREYQRLLKRIRQNPQLAATPRSASPPHVFEVGPDRKFALFSNDEKLRLQRCTRRARAKILEGHTRRIDAIAWRKDGFQAASGARDNTIRIWDIETMTCGSVLEQHHDRVVCLAFSPDQRQLVSGSRDHCLRLWDLSSKTSRVIGRHGGWVNAVAWNANPRFLLTACEDGAVRLFDLATNRCLVTKHVHRAGVRAVCWSTAPAQAISSDANGRVCTWDFSRYLTL